MDELIQKLNTKLSEQEYSEEEAQFSSEVSANIKEIYNTVSSFNYNLDNAISLWSDVKDLLDDEEVESNSELYLKFLEVDNYVKLSRKCVEEFYSMLGIFGGK